MNRRNFIKLAIGYTLLLTDITHASLTNILNYSSIRKTSNSLEGIPTGFTELGLRQLVIYR